MKIDDSSITELGRISAFLQAMFLVFVATIMFLVYGIQVLWFYQLSSMKLILAGSFLLAPCLLSFFLGLIAIIKHKDRNSVVIFSAIIGAVVILLILSVLAGRLSAFFI